MSDQLFREVARWIDAGAAPGGVVALWSPNAAQPEDFAYGCFAGSGSAAVATSTMYDVASVTKLFTTALILRLHERGQLSIYDTCGLYLPNFQHSEIRIIDLLTHRLHCGISLSNFCLKFTDSESLREALLQLVPPTAASSTITYANIQFFYLGIIIEYVTGHSLHTELTALFEELNLRHTCTAIDMEKQRLSVPPAEMIGGQTVQGVTHDESARMLGGLAGHAGVFSTAGDLAIFGKAWLEGRIVSREILQKMVFKNYDASGSSPQALGWWLRIKDSNDIVIPTPGVYSHVGYTGALLAISPMTGKVCAFTCNRTLYGRGNTKQRNIWKLLIDWTQS